MNIIQSVAIAELLKPTVKGESMSIPGMGQFYYDPSSTRARDGITTLNTAGTGRWLAWSGTAAHRALDQLVHNISEDSYTELTYSGANVIKVAVWTDSGKTLLIRETDITYSGAFANTITTKQYDAGGNLLETYTETINRTGATVNNITGVLT